MIGEFEIQVMNADKRREIINARVEQAQKKNEMEPCYAYSTELNLPVILLPIELPIYRLNNSRTKSWQLSYTEEHKKDLPATFFKDSENIAAQRVQHDRLVTLAKFGTGEEQPSIWSVLEEEKRQTETLLLTASGLVLNGNRRLAAMRELLKKIPSFANIRAAILPSWLREPDLLEIEARLQVAPDVRLPYDWTDEALLILSMREAGLKDERIAKILRKKESEIGILIDRFNEGKLFLLEGLKEPTNYDALVPHEQNFTELTKATKNASADEKEVSRLICNTITRHHKDATRRLYDYRIMYGKPRVVVLREFARRKNIPLDSTFSPLPQTTGADDDLFEDASESAPETSILTVKFAPVIEALKKDADSAANATLLREIGDELIDLKSDDRVRSLALKKIDRARLLLEQVTLDKADPETFTDMRQKLTAIEAAIAQVRLAMKRIEKDA